MKHPRPRLRHPHVRPRQRVLCGLLAACLGLGSAAPAVAQVRLPALGESVSEEVSVSAEKRLGDQVMREIRRDPDYADDPLLLDYLTGLWQPLVAAARARGDIGADVSTQFAWEAFLVRDRSVNAFALPGGYVGVHLGLIAMTASRDELASVLAHELSHVSQRHIARSSTNASRQGTLATVAMILGMIAAARSGNADVAQAAVMGGQAAAVQGQLNFSRDMEREADRVGFGVLTSAGYSPAGMAAMFEKLEQAQRLNDSGAYPYLRSHPLTSERIGEARMRATQAGAGTPVQRATAALHILMQARARVLMDGSTQALRRLQDLDGSAPANGTADRVGALYASAMASAQLRDFARAERAWAAARALPRGGVAAADAEAERALELLGVQIALAQGDARSADERLSRWAGDGSRALVLLRAQAALAQAGAPEALRRNVEALQAWTAEHRQDAAAWSLLAQGAERLGLKLRALRADAESHAALGDLSGAMDRLRAGQRQARAGGVGLDFIEASVIDARLRELQAQQRQHMTELREARGGRGEEPPQQ
jgi:predicted Zn-dependent protease